MQKSGAKAYLVNTGWNGTGKRISIKELDHLQIQRSAFLFIE